MGTNYLKKIVYIPENAQLNSDYFETDTNYIVIYQHNLNTEIITLKENIGLIFEGGSFHNGTIKFNNTFIDSPICCFEQISVSGSVLGSVIVDWFIADYENANIGLNTAFTLDNKNFEFNGIAKYHIQKTIKIPNKECIIEGNNSTLIAYPGVTKVFSYEKTQQANVLQLVEDIKKNERSIVVEDTSMIEVGDIIEISLAREHVIIEEGFIHDIFTVVEKNGNTITLSNSVRTNYKPIITLSYTDSNKNLIEEVLYTKIYHFKKFGNLAVNNLHFIADLKNQSMNSESMFAWFVCSYSKVSLNNITHKAINYNTTNNNGYYFLPTIARLDLCIQSRLSNFDLEHFGYGFWVRRNRNTVITNGSIANARHLLVTNNSNNIIVSDITSLSGGVIDMHGGENIFVSDIYTSGFDGINTLSNIRATGGTVSVKNVNIDGDFIIGGISYFDYKLLTNNYLKFFQDIFSDNKVILDSVSTNRDLSIVTAIFFNGSLNNVKANKLLTLEAYAGSLLDFEGTFYINACQFNDYSKRGRTLIKTKSTNNKLYPILRRINENGELCFLYNIDSLSIDTGDYVTDCKLILDDIFKAPADNTYPKIKIGLVYSYNRSRMWKYGTNALDISTRRHSNPIELNIKAYSEHQNAVEKSNSFKDAFLRLLPYWGFIDLNSDIIRVNSIYNTNTLSYGKDLSYIHIDDISSDFLTHGNQITGTLSGISISGKDNIKYQDNKGLILFSKEKMEKLSFIDKEELTIDGKYIGKYNSGNSDRCEFFDQIKSITDDFLNLIEIGIDLTGSNTNYKLTMDVDLKVTK